MNDLSLTRDEQEIEFLRLQVLEQQHVIDDLSLVCLRLHQCAGEAIQQVTFLAIRFLKPLFDHAVDNTVRYELSSFHIGLCFFAKVCSFPYIFSQHIAC